MILHYSGVLWVKRNDINLGIKQRIPEIGIFKRLGCSQSKKLPRKPRNTVFPSAFTKMQSDVKITGNSLIRIIYLYDAVGGMQINLAFTPMNLIFHTV